MFVKLPFSKNSEKRTDFVCVINTYHIIALYEGTKDKSVTRCEFSNGNTFWIPLPIDEVLQKINNNLNIAEIKERLL